MTWTTEKINQLSIEIENGKSLKSILRDISIDVLLDKNSKSPIFPFYLPNKGKIDANMRSSNVPFELTDSEMEKYNLYYQNPIDLYEIVKKYWPIRVGSLNHTPIHEKVWINNYYQYRFNLIISSSISETFKLSFFCIFHYLLFNCDKSVIVFSNSHNGLQDRYFLTTEQTINYFLYKYYRETEFYLKPGISLITDNLILFDNNSRITILEYDKSKIYEADFILIPDLDEINKDITFNFVPMLAKSETRMMICKKDNLYNSNSFSIFEKLNIIDYLREENLDKLI